METLLVTVKDPAKKNLLLALLAELDFVQVELTAKPSVSEATREDGYYSLFDSAGLTANRKIDADQLRTSAWKR